MRHGALLLLLASCASPPSAPDPGVRPPDAWTAAATEAGTPPADPWGAFGDPKLEALVREALEKNPGLRAAAAAVRAAEARARIAGADLYPQAGGSGSAIRSRRNFIGFPIPGGGGDVLSTTTTTYGVSLDLSWEIDLWGRLDARGDAARADLEAQEADFAGARISLAAQTGKAYLAAVEAERQVELARSTVETHRSTTARIRERYRRGLRPALDLKLAEANLAASEALLAARERPLDHARRQLELLVGRYPAARVDLAGDLPALPPPVPAGLPSRLLSRRPDLVAAERRAIASSERVREAGASLLPRFSLTASGGTASDDLSDLVDRDFRVWTLAGNLMAPIFQGGRLRAGLDLAKAGEEQALALYAEAALRAFGEVETALAADRILERNETALRRSAEEARAAHWISRQRYAGGLADILMLLDAQQGEFLAESRLLDVRRARLEARVNLHLALGGGFDSTFETELTP